MTVPEPVESGRSSAPRLEDAAEKRARLHRAKRAATALLALAAAILVAARAYPHPSFVAAFVRAAAEAAIVGGLADWFAVTALFRKPLGLPIPHTALIPERKDEIGRSLGRFVSEQFLEPDLLVARLRGHNRALQTAYWVDEGGADFLGERIAAIVPLLLAGTNDAELRKFFAGIAHDGLQRVDVQRATDTLIDALVRGGKHLALADAAITLLEPVLGALKEPIVARIGEATGRFLPRYFDRRLGEQLIAGFTAWLAAARTANTDERLLLEAWLVSVIARLRAAPEYPALLDRARAAIVAHPALMQSLGSLWDGVKAELLLDAETSSAKVGAAVAQALRAGARLLSESAAVQEHLNAAIENVLVSSLAPWRRNIGAYIAEIVAGWDGEKVADVIELQVGRDLQYIRVNGTIVGALIGAALFLAGAGLPVLWRYVIR
jgi:uncharacterized membrane-anchored protein YjiN (DUF445 family)